MRNPLRNRAIFVLSFVGLIIAGLLWNWHSHPQDIPCGVSGGCELVANSPYSRLPVGYGPPIAMYGTLGYLAILILSVLRTMAPNIDRPERDKLLRALILVGAILGAMFSARLTYMELNPHYIGAICKWCMASQLIILLIFGFAIAECSGSAARRTIPTGGQV